ncbi:MAG: hypothetical protein ABR589_10560 [Chthoniobacterales bacterium]
MSSAAIAMHVRSRVRLPALIGAVLLTAGCGTKEETPPVRIVALDRSFEAPQGIAAGLRHIIFENRGSEIHEAMFVKLPPGMTAESYLAAVKSGALFPEGAIDYSGPGLTSPGESVELWLKLDPGDYTLICWNSGHAKTTRTHHLRVEEVGAKPKRPPKEDVVLKLIDYRFELEGTLRPGLRTVRIETPGPAMHEVDFFRLHDGRTADDVRRWRKERGETPVPGVALGGALDSHDISRVVWLRRVFAPGRYVLLCQMPVTNTDLKHDDMGMVREIEVRD